MTSQQTQNPLRDVAGPAKFNVDGGSANLVANNVYSVEDIVKPLTTYDPTVGDPRLYASVGQRRSKIRWRKVNRRGWLSPKHKAQDDKDTVIQIKFAKPRRFNFIAFDLLRVPQTFKVTYYDSTRKRMVALTDLRGKKVAGDLGGTKVDVLRPGSDKERHKWRRFDAKLPVIKTNLIEIHLNRNVQSAIEAHGDFFGLPRDTPYRLGVRNLKIKRRVRDDDVDDDDGGDGVPGTTERAIIRRHTSINAHDGAETSYWECAPQGAATSVVPYYMDVREPDGTEAVFDVLKLVPLWPGPSMSVYFSSDETTLPWTLSPNRSNLDTDGNTAPTFTVGSGIKVSASDSSFTLDNQLIRMDTALGFSSGVRFTPSDTGGNDRWLWNYEDDDGHELGFRYNEGSNEFEVVQNASTVLATFSTAVPLAADTSYAVVVGYIPNDLDAAFPRGWYLSVSEVPGTNATSTHQFVVGTPPNGFLPSILRLGTNAAMTRPARGYLSYLWFKQDSYTRRGAVAYLLSPDGFIVGDGDQEQRVNGLYKGIVAAKLTADVEARVGPGAGFFRNKEWTPLPIDYSLAGTQYQLPVTKAKYLKLEFSNLIPRTYLTDLDELPVTDFPQWIKDWYRSIVPGRQGVPYRGVRDPGRNFYEGVPPVKIPGNVRKDPTVRSILDGEGGGGLPPIIYNRDQSTPDHVANPDLFDNLGIYKELQFATLPFRFHRTGRHEYVTHFVSVERRAFFVGLKELRVFRSNHAVLMDNPEYADTFQDDQYIDPDLSSGWINVGGVMQSGRDGDVITSIEFDSFSKFSTIQAAVLDSGWESEMTRAQIDLGDVTHLTDPQGAWLDPSLLPTARSDGFSPGIPSTSSTIGFEDEGPFTTQSVTTSASTSTVRTFVTGQYQGARGGNVIKLSRASGSADVYGVRTKAGLVMGAVITGDNPRTSVVVRMQLPETNNGTYLMRLFAGGDLVATRPIRLPIKTWQEVELAYVARTGDTDWQADVIQTDSTIDEPMVVDMLGIWQNPVKWEFSNDRLMTQTITVTWLGARDISELVDPEFPPQDLDLEYDLPNSFKLTYSHRASAPVVKGSNDTETASRIQEALLTLGLVATVTVASAGVFDALFTNTRVGTIGVSHRQAAIVSIATSLDDGTWYPVLWPLNKPNGYFRFPNADNRMRVRITALRANAVVSGWTVVPWYLESPMVARAPIDLNPPWNASDSDNLRDTSHKPIFRLWNHWFPQSYSINLYGYF